MGNNISLPQYQGSNEVMTGFNARVTAKQREYLTIIRKAMNCPSEGTALNLLTQAEAVAVRQHERQQHDYLPTTEPKPFTISYKYSKADRQALEYLRDFYNAPSRGDVVCHLLNQAIAILDAGKDGE